MSRSPKSPSRKQLTIGLILLLIILEQIFRPLNHLASSRALAAVSRGDHQQSIDRALVWYRVADTLAPNNPQIDLKLAQTYLKADQNKAALTNAEAATNHGAGTEALVVKSQALLELDQPQAAASAAEAAVQNSTNDAAAQTQLGLGYAAQDDWSKVDQMISLLGSSEAARTLSGLKHDHFALAQLFYAQGLLNSSQRILERYPQENSQYYLLRAVLALRLATDKKTGLEQGRGLLEKGLALSPERIDLRQLLQQIDNDLGDSTAAAEQGTKIQALQSGKI
ncbi:MAG TPA: hypothetical protein VLE72_03670 [Candidatus Saccharimonadales bacterium]|nr:hypothetical protein [Candidatus Saccharimonadales bacterium]